MFFHQSLAGLKQYPNLVDLSAREQFLYMDPQAFELMLPLMTCDSSSYTFLLMQQAEMNNNREFRQSHVDMMQQWRVQYDEAMASKCIEKHLEDLGFYDSPVLFRQ